MKRLQLSNNQTALVDDDWYKLLSPYTWSARLRKDGRCYILRTVTIDGIQIAIQLHKIIAGTPKDYTVSFRNKDYFDVTQNNLYVQNRGKEINWRASTKNEFIGVKWDAYHGLWLAHIKDIPIPNGYAISKIDAAKAYNQAAIRVYGQCELNTFDMI